jgi:hypothetical protein
MIAPQKIRVINEERAITIAPCTTASGLSNAEASIASNKTAPEIDMFKLAMTRIT